MKNFLKFFGVALLVLASFHKAHAQNCGFSRYTCTPTFTKTNTPTATPTATPNGTNTATPTPTKTVTPYPSATPNQMAVYRGPKTSAGSLGLSYDQFKTSPLLFGDSYYDESHGGNAIFYNPTGFFMATGSQTSWPGVNYFAANSGGSFLVAGSSGVSITDTQVDIQAGGTSTIELLGNEIDLLSHGDLLLQASNGAGSGDFDLEADGIVTMNDGDGNVITSNGSGSVTVGNSDGNLEIQSTTLSIQTTPGYNGSVTASAGVTLHYNHGIMVGVN